MDEGGTIEEVVRTRLRSLRRTLGLSLDELGARTNLSASTISRIETGRRTISLDVLLPLAAALQVELDVPEREWQSRADHLDVESPDRQHDRDQATARAQRSP
jgi:transcriptional regulator with XRE-family HTH domain